MVNLLLFEVDDIVHKALCQRDVFFEEFEVERSLRREGVFYITVKVDSQETATIVGTEGNFATRIGTNGTEPKVGIAVGDTFTQNCVPEEHTRLSTFPRIVYNFLPQSGGVNVFF